MNNVAACGCPDTLRALLAIIGLADEQCDGLGETLLGGPDVPVDTGAVGDSSRWTPLHTAALSSSSPQNVDVTAAVELCLTMVGACDDPHAWTNGAGVGGDPICKVGFARMKISRRRRWMI